MTHRHLYITLQPDGDLATDISAARKWLSEMDGPTYRNLLALLDADDTTSVEWVAALDAAGAPEPTSTADDWRGYIACMYMRGPGKHPCFACQQ